MVRLPTSKSRAWTLVELLVVLVIVLTVTSGIVLTFVQILRASDRSERMVQAHENARAAAEAIALFVKAARVEPTEPNQFFQGINLPTLQGDRVDNDNDGRIDEEQPDGLDNDADWVSADDRHAVIGGIPERQAFVGQPDLGDVHVDEDTVFHSDQLQLAIFPDPAVPGSRDEITSFSIGTWEDETNVLLQRTVRIDGTGPGVAEVAPLAFNVLSLNLLYWDPNGSQPYWVDRWDALSNPVRPAPGIELPAAVYISVTVYAGRIPLDQLGPTDPIESVTATTLVTVESIIHDPRYELIVRPAI